MKKYGILYMRKIIRSLLGFCFEIYS